jgi:hypothetical protein
MNQGFDGLHRHDCAPILKVTSPLESFANQRLEVRSTGQSLGEQSAPRREDALRLSEGLDWRIGGKRRSGHVWHDKNK